MNILSKLKKQHRKVIATAIVVVLGVLSVGGACMAGTQNFVFATTSDTQTIKKTQQYWYSINANKGTHRVSMHNKSVENPGGYMMVDSARDTSSGYKDAHSAFVKFSKAKTYSACSWSKTYKAGDFYYVLTTMSTYTDTNGYPSCGKVVLDYGHFQVLY